MAPRGRPRKAAVDAGEFCCLFGADRRFESDSYYSSFHSNRFTGATLTASSPSATRAGAFRGVFVAEPSKGTRTRKQRASTSASSSALTSPESHSTANESDTPDTSVATTPALSTGMGKRSKQTSSALKIEMTQDTDQDAAVARALQEQEYNIDDARKGKKRGTKTINKDISIRDSDDDSALSSAEDLWSQDEMSPDDEPPPKKRKTVFSRAQPKSKGKVRQGAPGPKRSARSSAQQARKKLATAGPIVVSDSESDFSGDSSLDVGFLRGEFGGDSSEAESESSSATPPSAAIPTIAPRSRAQHRARLPRQRSRRPRHGFATRAEYERYRLEVAHPAIKTMWDELALVPQIAREAAKQPQSITRSLKSFQLEGLNWMREQEKSQWGGGLLGDEMGMGKTIQAVSLIMSDYPQKQPTLVVVPPVALMQWSSEINEYTDGKLKVLVYHGSNTKAKKMSVKELMQFDVIMISYSSLESIHRKETKGWSREDKIVKEDSPVHAISFHRVILDEAHSIKSRTTGVAKACFALSGTYKWCLSGTPVQNRIGEFFSLLRFLRVSPFANYFCKNCDCSVLHWSVDKSYRCVHCNHRGLDHVSVFNQEILNPITSAEDDDTRKAAFAKLRLLTDRIMLRRLKRDYTASMELPPKEVILHNEFFGEIEKDFANSIMGQSARKFDTYVSRGVMLDNYANIFGLIMQMRQVSDHPDLITKKKVEGGQNILVCNICDEPAEDAIRSQCKHEFCRTCAKEFVKTCENSGVVPDCPRCHIALSVDFDQPEIEQDEGNVKSSSIINRIKMENWTSSTKIEMLVYDLWKLRSKKHTTKSIVFSQFTSMLQLVEWRLRRAGFNTVMLDGSMSPQQRQRSIEHFMNNTDVEVFLVSLKAGGVALNLTEASRVFVIDP